jgi:gamma-glutamyltranspeptidase
MPGTGQRGVAEFERSATAVGADDYRCAVASAHSLGTDAATAAVEAGGNALDAALAGAAVLSVVYPHNTSIGGDLFALVRDPQGEITSINASGAAGRLTDVALVRKRHARQMPVTGVETVTVPGALGGLAAIHALGAALPWRDAFAQAIVHAEQGVAIAQSVGRAIAECQSQIISDEGMRRIFRPDGRSLSTGDHLRNPALGRTLRTIADRGPGALYGGTVGASLTQGLRALGSALTLHDLASFQAQLEPPWCAPFRDSHVWTSPPNSQGFLFLEILSIIDALPPGTDLLGADADILASIFQLASADRGRLLTDPAHSPSSAEQVLTAAYVGEVAARIAQRQPSSGREVSRAVRQRPGGDTVAVVTADSDGWAVSLIQSLFHSFGSCILEPTTGLILHNRGSFFSLEPKSPNVLAPGKRPAHTLMPAMVTREDQLTLVMGTMGGTAQPQVLTQVLLKVETGASGAQAVAAPRFVVGGMEVGQPENSMHAEPNPGPAADSLASLGFPVSVLADKDEAAGHAQLVWRGTDGSLGAASDPRSDGSSVVARRRRP